MISHSTWLLSWNSEDTCLDAAGNIAVATGPYAVAQDVATQLSTFLGECWYDTSQGVPYWQQIFGGKQNPSGALPPASLIASLLEAQALLVPDVATATCTIAGIDSDRSVIGQMLITLTDDTTFEFPIGVPLPQQLRVLATQGGSPISIGGLTIEV